MINLTVKEGQKGNLDITLTWVMFGAEIGTQGRGTTKLAKVELIVIGV